MTKRDQLLDRIAEISRFSPEERRFPHPFAAGPFWQTDLSGHLVNLPDWALDELLLTTSAFMRRLAELGGRLDARPLGLFLSKVRIDLFDLMEEVVGEFGGVAGAAAGDDEALLDGVSKLPDGGPLLAKSHFGEFNDQHAESVQGHASFGSAPETTSPNSSFIAHLFLPLAAGLIAGAAGSHLLSRRRAA